MCVCVRERERERRRERERKLNINDDYVRDICARRLFQSFQRTIPNRKLEELEISGRPEHRILSMVLGLGKAH